MTSRTRALTGMVGKAESRRPPEEIRLRVVRTIEAPILGPDGETIGSETIGCYMDGRYYPGDWPDGEGRWPEQAGATGLSAEEWQAELRASNNPNWRWG